MATEFGLRLYLLSLATAEDLADARFVEGLPEWAEAEVRELGKVAELAGEIQMQLRTSGE